jgi:Domain of unknown function (DUF397)
MIEPGIDWSAVPFRKSSYSSTNGGNCVEVGWADIQFRKSSFSSTAGGQCVEVGGRRGVVGVRDSKNPAGGVLAIPATAWASFTDRVKP